MTMRAMALALCLAPALLAARLPDVEPEPGGDAADLKAMSGVWAIKKMAGPKAKEKSKEDMEAVRFTFTKDTISVKDRRDRDEPPVKFTINSKKSPREIDIKPPGDDKTLQGIYKIEKGELILAFTEPGAERPKKFDDEKVTLMVLHRPPPEKKDPPKDKPKEKEPTKDK